MKITCLPVGPLACNCYVLKDETSGEGVVIDPGGDADQVVNACLGDGITPRSIINTHGHADHVGANAALKRAFASAELCIGRGDAAQLRHRVRNLSVLLAIDTDSPEPDRTLQEGDRLEFGSCSLTVVETPGHTPGSICLVARQESPIVVFCGDLVFRGGVGRTDLPGGSMAQLKRSIEERVFTLPDDTVLWPGHGERTTVGCEKAGGMWW